MTRQEQELELFKLEVEFSRVGTAKMNLLLQIKESEVQIQRLQASIVQQDARLEELKIMIPKLKEALNV